MKNINMNLNSQSILLVDDEDIILEILESSIKDNRPDDQVTKTNSVIKAMELISNKENHFDILITDIRMDEMNGALFARAVLEKNLNIRVLLISGHLNILEQLSLFNLGVERMLQKPFKIDELIDAIANPTPVINSPIKKMVSVKIEELINRRKYPFDLYVHLGGDKIIKMFKANQYVDINRLEQFLKNDVVELFTYQIEGLNLIAKMYAPMRISNLKENRRINFNVYYLEDHQYLKLIEKGTTVTAEILSLIKKYQIKVLYIEDADEKMLIQYLEEILNEYLKTKDVSIEDKLGTTADIMKNQLKDVYHSPNDESVNALKKSEKILQSFLKSEKASLPHLFTMSEKCEDLYAHSLRVASLSYAILLEIEAIRKDDEIKQKIRALDEFIFDSDDVKDIVFTGGILHDIGTNVVKGALVEEMEKNWFNHPMDAFLKLQELKSVPAKVLEIILQHEEFCDGSGFPNHLVKTQMSFFAQVVSLANYYDKLFSKHKMSNKEVLKVIENDQQKFNRHLIFVLNRVVADVPTLTEQ